MRDTYAVIAIAVLTNGPLFLIARRVLDRPGTWEGPVLRPILLAVILGGVLIVVLDPLRGWRRMSPPSVAVMSCAVGLGLWAALSTHWSFAPEITLWRGLLYAALPFVAWVIADLDNDRLMNSLAISFGVLVVASLAMVLLWPSAGLDHNDDWRGVFTGRNSLAPVCAVLTILGISRFGHGRRVSGGLFVALGFVGLLGSGSRTAWLALGAALGVAGVVAFGRVVYVRRPSGRALGATVGVGVLFGATGIGLLSRFWNESTFAQRRTIWSLVGDHIVDRPWRGFGFDAFWHVPDFIGAHELLQRGSAHGSVPELLLGLGVIGLLPWLVVVGLALGRSLRDCWRAPSLTTWTWLALVLFLAMENLSESFVSWFSYNWVLLIVFALRCGRESKREPLERTRQPIAVATE